MKGEQYSKCSVLVGEEHQQGQSSLNRILKLNQANNGEQVQPIKTLNWSISERVDVNLEDYIPPYKKGTFADEIVLAEDAFFVRVHNQRNQVGRWMITVEDFKVLTTDQAKFKDLFALPSMPAIASLVKVPKGTKIWKGQVDGNKWGNGGGIQIQVDEWAKYLDDRDDWFKELGKL
jgi:hypothetical protein